MMYVVELYTYIIIEQSDSIVIIGLLTIIVDFLVEQSHYFR